MSLNEIIQPTSIFCNAALEFNDLHISGNITNKYFASETASLLLQVGPDGFASFRPPPIINVMATATGYFTAITIGTSNTQLTIHEDGANAFATSDPSGTYTFNTSGTYLFIFKIYPDSLAKSSYSPCQFYIFKNGVANVNSAIYFNDTSNATSWSNIGFAIIDIVSTDVITWSGAKTISANTCTLGTTTIPPQANNYTILKLTYP